MCHGFRVYPQWTVRKQKNMVFAVTKVVVFIFEEQKPGRAHRKIRGHNQKIGVRDALSHYNEHLNIV